MKPEELKTRNFEDEFNFSASRSSGPGGQNINKLNTKVELRFSIFNSRLLTPQEKYLIGDKLANKISKEGELILVSQSERTQLLNKKAVTEKFFFLVSKALTIPAKRRSTNPTISSVNKRLDTKRNLGIKKKLRRISGDKSEED